MPPSRQARAASDMPLPRRKARGSRLSGQRIARAFHRINFIMISEKNGGGLADTTWRKVCRRNARIPQPIEAAPPFPFRGTALYSKKPWHFGTGASRTQSVRTRRNDVPICIDSRRSRPVPQRPETAHRHRARPDGRGRGGGRARRHPARAVAPARSHPAGYFHARTQRRGGHTPYQGGCAGSAHPYRFHARHGRTCTRGP